MAAWYTRPVNPEHAESLRIYSYDLWWPPLQLWLAACLVATGLAEPMFSRGLSRAFVLALALAAVARLALLRPEFAGPSSEELWKLVGLVALPAAWAMAGWLAVPWPLRGQGHRRTAAKAGVPLIGAALGIVVVLLGGGGEQGGMGGTGSALVILAWPLLLGAFRWRLFYWFWVDRGRVTARDWGIFASVALIAATITELFYVAGLAPGMVLTFFLLAWIVFSEVLYPGALSRFCVHAATGELLGKASPVRVAWRRFATAVTSGWAGVSALLAALFSAPSFPVALLKVVAAVLLLVALAEIPNAGKTVVLALQTPEGPAYKGIGQAVADHVVSSLAVLNDELLPDLIVLKDLTQGARATSHGSSTLDAAFAKSSDLKWGEVTIPLGTIVAPIQGPVRALLGVRVVSGSLHESRWGYALLAESTLGESWRVDRTPGQLLRAADGGCTAKTGDAKFRDAKAGKAKSAPAATPEVGPGDAAPLLAEELAFRIRRGDPRLTALGMTQSWEAFDCFRKGLRNWRRFEVTGSFDELGRALDGFRTAIQIDPAFALAHYRLALALQKDGQPAQAVEALRESLRASPDFLPAVAALATTLWDFDSFYFTSPAAFSRDAPDPEVGRVRRAEARDLWQRLVQSSAAEVAPLDLASANYGLCLETFETRNVDEPTLLDLANIRRDMSIVVGKLDDARITLEGVVVSAAGTSSETPGAKSGSTALEAVEEEATAALDTMEETLYRARDLLARAGLEGRDKSVGLDEAQLLVEDARGSLAEVVRGGSKQGSRPNPERVKQLRADAVAAFSRVREAMSTLVTGDVGAGLSRALQVYQARHKDQPRMTYFYCKRGEELYGRLPKERRAAPAVRRAEGLVLNMLGVLLEGAGWAPVMEKVGWHCRQEDYADPNAVEGGASRSSYSRGPHAGVALNYYQRAAALLPEAWVVRCNGARVARAMGDERPMYALSTSAEARTELGDELLDRGQSDRDTSYLRRALREFREAIRRDPHHIASLNEFAYSAWQWRWLQASGEDADAPDAQTLSEAERYARAAVALTASRFDPGKRAQVRATLGEILLAQSRAHEAVEELRSALNDLRATVGAGADHAAFHELRWDLAKAALCAAAVDERTGFNAHARQLRAEAAAVLAALQDNERQREVRIFGDASGAPDSLRAPAFCDHGAPGDAGDGGKASFRLASGRHSTAGHLVCGSQWVKATVRAGAAATDGLQLEVWGGGVQLRVDFSPAGTTQEVAFADRPEDTHHFYFAQLTQSGEPRSAVHPLQTFAARPGGTCSRNLLVLEFDSDTTGARKRK
ncbi:MAG: hypothetical protein AABM64_10815 [Pseudomonadota bacterium]